ncbi:hypothetical protein Hdeb2414_s0023g00626991 [Helianthus debilis subsp. tardiflorus]
MPGLTLASILGVFHSKQVPGTPAKRLQSLLFKFVSINICLDMSLTHSNLCPYAYNHSYG